MAALCRHGNGTVSEHRHIHRHVYTYAAAAATGQAANPLGPPLTVVLIQ
jgi:hypothetical protein